MSNKALILAILILGGLAGIAVFLPKLVGKSGGASSAGSPDGAFVLPIQLAEIVSIELSRGGQVESGAVRTPAGGWAILDSQQNQWPGTLRTAASQALAALSLVEPQDGLVFTHAAEGVLAFGLRDGTTVSIEFAQTTLGGRRVIRAGSLVAVVEERILRPLIDPGPISWRSSAAIPGVRRASRFELIQQGGSLELAKLSGRWRLRQPLGVRADERAVIALTDALAALSAREFLDDVTPDPITTGVASPRLIIAYESDRRVTGADSQVRIETIRQELHIGGPASASGDTLYARASGRHSVWMLVNASSIAAISTTARNYIEPTITGVLPSDVFRITLRRGNESNTSVYQRIATGWIDEQGGGSSSANLDQQIKETLEFLSSRPGEPEVSAGPSELSRSVEIELGDLNGGPLEIIVAGYTADGVLGFLNQNLLMLFDDARAPELLGLSDGS